MKVTITPNATIDRPISPLIYGGFIENGFGRQVEGMWAEMFFNRAFEQIPPYEMANYHSRGSYADTDITKHPYWHSGYEENNWFLAPGNDQAKWEYTRHVSFHKGHQAGWLANDSKDQWAGFAQNGIFLKEGDTYEFTGMIRTAEGPWDLAPSDVAIQEETGHLTQEAEIRIYREGDWQTPVFTHKITNVDQTFQRFNWRFECKGFQGRATFSVWVPPKSNLCADDFSLMPTSNINGWRADMIEAAKRVNVPMIRWPGGCFASFYHWREGIGPREDRTPNESWYWGGLHDNDVGTIEYLELCDKLGAQPFICFNMLTGSPDEAADWVAYCNAPASHPLGALRASHGHKDPFGVEYWELDNECFRRFSWKEYAERTNVFAEAMRKVDPSIKLALVGYDQYRENIGDMLEICGKSVNFVVDRSVDEAILRKDLDVLRAYNAKAGTDVRLCNTEWPAPQFDIPKTLDEKDLEGLPTSKSKRTAWYSGMNVAKTLLLFQRLGGDFHFGSFNNFANTWGQNVIECPKEGTYLSAAGLVIEMLSRCPARWTLETKLDTPDESVVVQAAVDDAKTTASVIVLNYTADEIPMTIDLSQLGTSFASAEFQTLSAPTLITFNTLANPNAISQTAGELAVSSSELTTHIKPFSLTQIVVE